MRQLKSDQFEEILKHFNDFEGDDAIIQTMKLRKLTEAFDKSVASEKLMSDFFDVLNTRALEQGDTFIQKFITIVTSRQFEAININGKIIRHAMLEILQKNFQSADKFKRDDMKKFYNSIRLLGEYYNKARISNGNPINILATSLLNLVNVEMEKELKNILHFKNDEFCELLLDQIALNGPLLKTRHKTEIEVFLLHTRRCLIEIDSLTSKTKAFLLMILDLYYSNFNHTTLESCLDKLYKKYINDSHSEKVQNKKENGSGGAGDVQKGRSDKSVVKQQENGKASSTTTTTNNKKTPSTIRYERRSESYSRSVPPRSPIKTSPPTRKSEPHSYRSQTQPPPSSQNKSPQKITTSSPPKRISPKDIRNRVRTPPQDKNQHPQPAASSTTSPKSLFKVEKDLDKLNIEAANQPTRQIQPIVDENILRQQNSSENSSPVNTLKPKPSTQTTTTAGNNKVYFREENAENLSWNGETSFEDDPETTIESPRTNQYSSSFLNFLSNN